MKGLRPPLEVLWDYFTGEPPLSEVQRGFDDYMRRILRTGRLNIAGLLVSSTGARLSLRGFQTAEANDEAGDQLAREMMTETGLAMVSRDAHDFMLALGEGYILATAPEDGEKWPTATAEDPRQVITAEDPATGAPRGGLKMYRDDWDAADVAFVYLPEDDGSCTVQKLIRRGARSCITDGPFRLDPKAWDLDGDEDHADRFPIVRLRNKRGIGEFEEHLDSLDRINDKIFNEWWTGKMQAHRQRAVKGLPETDEKGEEVDYSDAFSADPGAIWQLPEGVEFWESQPLDMTGITNSIKQDLERLAAATSQPLHTITPDAATGSAEGASLMREEHIFKIEDRRDRVTPPWARFASIMFDFANQKESRSGILPIWGPAQRYSMTEKSQGASQVQRVLPLEAIWKDVLQYDPAEIPNLRAQMGRSLLMMAALNGAVPGQQPGGQPALPAGPSDNQPPPANG